MNSKNTSDKDQENALNKNDVKRSSPCYSMISFADDFGHENYRPCSRPAKYMVNMINFITKENSELLCCGVHMRSLETMSINLRQSRGFDSRFESRTINPPF